MVFIPDSNFRNYISNNIPGAIIGDSLDTQNWNVKNWYGFNLSNSNIYDLTGIDYFIKATDLYADHNNLIILPTLPATMQIVDVTYNFIDSIAPLPPNLIDLNCSYNIINKLPLLPSSLLSLLCNINNISSLPSLPNSLINLLCAANNLDSLPTLPPSLYRLQCSDNNLHNLPLLSTTIGEIYANDNFLDTFPELPGALFQIEFSNNLFTQFPVFKNSVQYLVCENNFITSIDSLPPNLVTLNCNNNNLISLPLLPVTLKSLSCNDNSISVLPTLDNQLLTLDCRNNQLECLPILPNSLMWLKASGNNIQCLPNVSAYPYFESDIGYVVCNLGNENCEVFPLINGKVFFDANNNGLLDVGEIGIKNHTVQISPSVWLGVTDSAGYFSATVDTGSYSINAPVTTYQSISTLLQSALSLNYGDVDSLNNIGIFIPSNITDLNVHIITSNEPVPGFNNYFDLIYSNVGATTQSGLISLVLDSKYDFINAIPFPVSISGDTLVWNYALLNPFDQQIIKVELHVPDSIPSGIIFKSTAQIFPVALDTTPNDNIFELDEMIVNAWDPNNKNVSPSDAIETTNISPVNFPLTFTIHFQNTGTAPAQNILLLDSLSNKLNLQSFKFIGSSHPCKTQIYNSKLSFKFDNINLPDSGVDFSGSQGWVQFEIKTGVNVSLSDSILNGANIYFDYNLPVQTNITKTVFFNSVFIKENLNVNDLLYPNPFHDFIQINLKDYSSPLNFELYNLAGQSVLSEKISGTKSKVYIGKKHIPPGIYFYNILNDQKVIAKGKLISN